MFKFKNKKNINNKNDIIKKEKVITELKNFQRYLSNMYQGENQEPYGKGYDIAIERIESNFNCVLSSIQYMKTE